MVIRARHVLTALVVSFGVTLSVNALLVGAALRSFRGVDAAKSYTQGLNYEAVLRQRASQAKARWRAELGWQQQESGQMLFRLGILDGQNTPVPNLTFDARLQRPVNAAEDRVVTFKPSDDERYQAIVEGLAKGQWDLIVEAKDDGSEIIFAMRNRVMIP